jgi:membrane-associated phospholipid phosphatase
VGASRVCLGVHWPADVVAGWLFVVGWLCLTDPG